MPGMAPRKEPIRDERSMIGMQALNSAQVMWSSSGWAARRVIRMVLRRPRLTWWMTSGRQSRPMTIGISERPEARSCMPKVKRVAPVDSEMPMVETRMPRQQEMMPLISEGPEMLPTTVRARMIRLNCSAEPILRVNRDRGAATKMSSRLLKVSPKTEAESAVCRALPALPCRAKG